MILARKMALLSLGLALLWPKVQAAEAPGEMLYALERRTVTLQSPFQGHTAKPAMPEQAAVSPPAERHVQEQMALQSERETAYPRLCGVIGGAEGYLAILEIEGRSGVYRTGDVAGDYIVNAVTADEAELGKNGAVCRIRIGQ